MIFPCFHGVTTQHEAEHSGIQVSRHIHIEIGESDRHFEPVINVLAPPPKKRTAISKCLPSKSRSLKTCEASSFPIPVETGEKLQLRVCDVKTVKKLFRGSILSRLHSSVVQMHCANHAGYSAASMNTSCSVDSGTDFPVTGEQRSITRTRK